MTEAEWLACAQPQLMLEFIGTQASERKLRLFAVACIHRTWREVRKRRCRTAVELAEQYADSQAPLEDLIEACDRAWDVVHEMERSGGDDWPEQVEYAAAWAAAQASRTECEECPYYYCVIDTTDSIVDLVRYAVLTSGGPSDEWAAAKAEQLAHADLLRDIFGNPFRPICALSPTVLSWNDGTVRRMADSLYEGRTFDRLPILADALLDAGCDSEDLIGHCRSQGPHTRGCWAVDLILGKG